MDKEFKQEFHKGENPMVKNNKKPLILLLIKETKIN